MAETAVVIKESSTEAVVAEEAPEQTALSVSNIPAAMWNKHKDDIINFMGGQIGDCEGERSNYLKKVARWKALYDGPLRQSPKNFPFAGASNLDVPLIKEIVNTIASQIVQSTMTATPRWIFTDLGPEWEPFIDELERFMDTAAIREMNYDKTMVNSIVEMCKIGNAIIETSYSVETQRQYRYTPDGKNVYPKEIVKRDGPITREVPIQNFWIRFDEESIEKARWVAKELYLSKMELISLQKQRKLNGVERIFDFERLQRAAANDVKQTEEELDSVEPTEAFHYRVFEFHLRWDIDDDPDGMMEDLIIYFHQDSNSILGQKFAHYWHGLRPFDKLGFFPMPGRFYHQGLAEMLESIQIAISAQHNKRADNATLANMKMFIKRSMMRGLMPGDLLFPGKIIEANDIWNDVRDFSMAEIYPSTINEESILRGYADKLAGTNEGSAGAAMPVTRTTATAQLALLQEQARRLDLTIRNVREVQRSVGRKAIYLYQQFGTLGKAIAWLGTPGRRIEALFSLPRRVAEIGDAIRVNVPTSTSNKQVKRENALAMFNLLNQMYQQLIPLVGQLIGPEALAPVVKEMVTGAKKFMGDALESFDNSDPDQVLAGLTLLEKILPSAEDLGGLADFERAEAASETIDAIARLDSLLRESEGVSSRGPGVLGSDKRQGSTIEAPGGVAGPNLDSLIGGESPTRFGQP